MHEEGQTHLLAPMARQTLSSGPVAPCTSLALKLLIGRLYRTHIRQHCCLCSIDLAAHSNIPLDSP